MELQLHLAGEERTVTAEELGTQGSERAGQELRRVRLDFIAHESLSDQLNEQLSDAGGSVQFVPLTAADGSRWRVETWSSSWPSNDPQMRYDVELHEIEAPVTVTRLRLEELDLEVEHYSEMWPPPGRREGGVVLEPSIVLPAENVDRFVELLAAEDPAEPDQYRAYDVTLVGHPRPERRVRLGVPLWQSLPNGDLRVQIGLVPQDPPLHYTETFSDVVQRRVRRMLLGHEQMIEELLGELSDTGVLDAEARDRIRNARIPLQASRRVHLDLFETDDIEQHWEDHD